MLIGIIILLGSNTKTEEIPDLNQKFIILADAWRIFHSLHLQVKVFTQRNIVFNLHVNINALRRAI